MKLECAAQIVADCLLVISREQQTVNLDETLQSHGITDDFQLAYLQRLIASDAEIGIRRVNHEIAPRCLVEVKNNWLVKDLVMLVRNCAVIDPEAVIKVDLLIRKALKKRLPEKQNFHRWTLQTNF